MLLLLATILLLQLSTSTDETCDDEVTPTEPIGIAHSDVNQNQYSDNFGLINLSECISQDWLNQNGTIDGYHVLCVIQKPTTNMVFIEYFREGVNDTSHNGNITISINEIHDINNIRNIIENTLSISSRGYGYNQWTMFNIEGKQIETLNDFLACGTLLIYEGGIFVYPPIYIGFERIIKLQNANKTEAENDNKPFKYYKLTTISYHPIILLIEDFIPSKYCDHIISISEPFMKESGVSHMHNTAGSARKWRTSTTHWLRPAKDDEIVRIINDYTAQILRIPLSHQELIQVLRYKDTQQYDNHWDYFDPDLYKGTNQENTIKYGKNRMVTLYWYLNDVPNGGGGYTFFPQSGKFPRPRSFKLVTIDDCHTNKGLNVKPKKGNAIIFYNLKPNGNIDPLSLHGACPVVGKENIKWGANKWVWTKPF